MALTPAEIKQLEQDINAQLASYNAMFIMTIQLSASQINEARSDPPLEIRELRGVFSTLISKHIIAIVALNHKDSFNIHCSKSHINMPCVVAKEDKNNGTASHKNIVISVMRKKGLFAKEPLEFKV